MNLKFSANPRYRAASPFFPVLIEVSTYFMRVQAAEAPSPMPICPICKSEAADLDKVGLADGSDCPNPKHGRFKVSSTVLETPKFRDAPREDWEAALKKGKGERAARRMGPLYHQLSFLIGLRRTCVVRFDKVRPPALPRARLTYAWRVQR
jgi:hypothetical protein